MEKYFTLDMPATRFARNTLVVSLLGLVPLLVVYITLTPGFAGMLLNGGPALSRFVRQVLTNGLPVVFMVNWVSFFLFALLVARQGQDRGLSLVFLIDLPARIVMFTALHAAIYVVSADWFGSFGGSKITALTVVAPTLARSALFENISGVYLYATLVSALPLYITAVDRRLPTGGGSRFWRSRTVRLSVAIVPALALFALFVVLLTAIAAAIAGWQST